MRLILMIVLGFATWHGSAQAKTTREAAQAGIDYLSEATPAWQEQHQCFGCHVQAVTMHALSMAKRNQYNVDAKVMRSVLAGLTTVKGGTQSQHGLSHSRGAEQGEAKSYGGSALAFYDQHVYQDAQDDLIKSARALLKFQKKDGSVHPEVARFPVSPGAIHTTYMAIQTWRQAYARTADDEWRVPLRKSELWLKKRALNLTDGVKPQSIQDLNFSLLGLLEAGTSQRAKSVRLLEKAIGEYQNKDGGFGFRKGEASNAYATGQTLFAFRTLGLSDTHNNVRRASAWLVGAQQANGAWSSGGRGKAEALWGVLGLVGVDVAQIDLVGIKSGERVEGDTILRASATSEKDIREMSVIIDDVPVFASKGSKLSYTLSPKTLKPGLHLVDVVAKTKHSSARRRIEIYTGDVFLTDVGSRFEEEGTRFSFRKLGQVKNNRVRLEIFDGKKRVHQSLSKGTISGAHNILWKGDKDALTKTLRARLSFIDDEKVRHVVEHTFTHDTLKAQRERLAQVQGRLAIDNNASAGNTEVELVDELGKVVQRQRTTRSGQYRFKNVKKNSKYKVRVRKKGFKSWSADVSTEKAENAASASLERE